MSQSELLYSIRWLNRVLFVVIFCLLIFFFLISSLFGYQLSPRYFRQKKVIKTMYYVKSDGFNFHVTNGTFGSADALLRIYEQQLSRWNTALFLPSYQNHRLILKLDLTAIAKNLYGNVDHFQGSIRHLRIVCLEKHRDATAFQTTFNFTLLFDVQKVQSNAIYFTLKSIPLVAPPLIVSTVPNNGPIDSVTQIIIRLDQVFPTNTIFMFTYQWLDSNTSPNFSWPRWPLSRSCAQSILNGLVQKSDLNSNLYFSCSMIDVLSRSTSRQIFAGEQQAISEWLDVQHLAMITDAFPSDLRLKTRRLIPFETATNETICSSEFQQWISKYQQWHENITSSITDPRLTIEQQRDRIVQLNIRFILYEKLESGVADRMTHLMTTYLISILTNRLLVFDSDWPDLLDSMQSSLNYERELVIPWFRQLMRLNRGLTRKDATYLSSRRYKFGFDRLKRDYDYEQKLRERFVIILGHIGGIGHMMMSNSSIYRQFLTNDLRMNVNNMFGCLYHSLFIYRLSALIDSTSPRINANDVQQEKLGQSPQQILQILLSPIVHSIGVQVRAGDPIMQDEAKKQSKGTITENALINPFQYFLTCADNLLDRNHTSYGNDQRIPLIYLMSDTVRLRQSALRHRPFSLSCLRSSGVQCRNPTPALPVVANPDPVFHITYTSQLTLAFQTAMFDLFLFSLCEQHVISTDSGFGRIAAFASLKQKKIYSLSSRENITCQNSNQSISLAKSSYDWSGI